MNISLYERIGTSLKAVKPKEGYKVSNEIKKYIETES